MNDPIILPISTIQPDFLDVISDVQTGTVPSETIWISCYKKDHPSVHGKVDVVLDEVDRDTTVFEVREADVELKRSGASYIITCPSLGVRGTPVLVPSGQYKDPEYTNPQRPPHRITSFDISPDGTQFACGYMDGSVRLTSTSTSYYQRISKLHLSTVSYLSFFPSSRVLLTAGADFALAILPAEPPSSSPHPSTPNPARRLKGHSRAITSTAIISRGRNVLSASKDGTLRLWDSSSGTQICMMGAGKGKYTPINAMVVGERGYINVGPMVVNGVAPRDDREVDTADKLVFCALQDGTFEVFDLASKNSIFQSEPVTPTGLTAIAYSASRGWIATGSSRGLVTVYSTKTTLSSQPLCSFIRNEASIEDLAFYSEGLVVITDDGLPYIVSLQVESSPAVRAEIVGSDCDGLRVVRIREEQIWLAGDDGIVRMYHGI